MPKTSSRAQFFSTHWRTCDGSLGVLWHFKVAANGPKGSTMGPRSAFIAQKLIYLPPLMDFRILSHQFGAETAVAHSIPVGLTWKLNWKWILTSSKGSQRDLVEFKSVEELAFVLWLGCQFYISSAMELTVSHSILQELSWNVRSLWISTCIMSLQKELAKYLIPHAIIFDCVDGLISGSIPPWMSSSIKLQLWMMCSEEVLYTSLHWDHSWYLLSEFGFDWCLVG